MRSQVGARALVVLVGLALTACGSAPPSDGGAGTSVTAAPHDATASDLPLSPTPDPRLTILLSAPAPQAFTDRAVDVAAAVRGAGIPAKPTRPLLVSSWAVDAGFDTDVQKVAWGHGHVEFGPGVDTNAVGSGTLRLHDGSARPVDVIGARDALNRALDGALDRPSDCAGIPGRACRVEVTAVALTEDEAETTQGKVTLPVWRLTIDGLSHSISVIAVADGAIQRPSPPTPVAGLPDPPLWLKGAETLERVGPSSIMVRIGHGACDANLAAHVVEFDDLVVVGATSDHPAPDTVCSAIHLSTPAELSLTRPLGDRVVIDVVTGTPRFLGWPLF